eukprot:TRINITY_DN2068_c0_g1_i2.p1 TRINITY_DN2068_c0_g1~~TRINITY_DN2068_c0_g1_i2.p1  ORF type:complete len:320 (+),score=53.65 TRINITY_DN2068_c0_g1_i2:620-1579(+)
MDASMPCGNSDSDNIGFKSYVNSRCYGSNLSYAKHQDFTCAVGESAKEIPREDVTSRTIKMNDNVMVGELEITLDQIQHIHNIQEKEVGHISNSVREEICQAGETCPELENHQDLIAKTCKVLSKCATFPCSEKFLSSPTSVDGRDMMPATSLHVQSSLRSEPPAYLSSMSMPTPSKLISAMKGGREQHGAPMKTKMNVKWAPDVYDPPATSLSHTVKSHHRRPKAKKRDHHKHKHSKGKSARGSGSEKKQHTNRTILCNSYPSHLRFSAPGDGLLLDDFDQSSVEVVDFAVSKQDTKCGSSFLRASLSRMHISVAEAT